MNHSSKCVLRAHLLTFALLFVTHDSYAQKTAAPTGLWAAQTDRNVVTLVWKNTPGLQAYNLYRDTPGMSRPRLVAMLAPNSNHYVVIVRRNDPSPLQYYLEAVRHGRETSPQVPFNPVTVITPTRGAVPAPASVTAREESGHIVLTWTPVEGATAYQIFRAVGGSGTGTLCGLCPTKTELIDTITTTNVKYLYAVAAITPAGVSLRTRSNDLTPTTAAVDATTDAGSSQLQLSGLYAEQVAPRSFHLRWNATPNASSYAVSAEGMRGETRVAMLPANAVEYTARLDNRDPSQTVQFYLQAKAADGQKSARVPFNTVKLATSGNPPKPPANVSALNTARGQVTVAWQPGEDATRYAVERNSTRDRVLLCDACTGDTTFVDTTAEGRRYTYLVTAVNARGSSTAAVSNPVDAGIQGSGVPTLQPIANTRLDVRGDTILLSWRDDDRNVTGFRITRAACGNTTTFDQPLAQGPQGQRRHDLMSGLLKLPECMRTAKPVSVQYSVAPLYHTIGGDIAQFTPVQAGTGTPPGPPTNLEAEVIDNYVSLTWQPPREEATEYLITRKVCGVETTKWVRVATRQPGTADLIAPILSLPECTAAHGEITAHYSVAAARYGLTGPAVAFPAVVLPKTVQIRRGR